MDTEFYSKIGKLGGEKTHIEAIEKYYENPKTCKNCENIIKIRDGEIPSQTRKRVFCCYECQSEYQRKKMIGNKIRKKEQKYCLFCGTEIGRKAKKYCSNFCQSEYQYQQYIKKWKQGLEDGMKGAYQLSSYIKRYLFEKYDNKCCKCGWSQINPCTGNIPLETHHKDGDYTNNDENNLELLCPNCHSLTDTYKNSLNHEGRKGRNKYYKIDNFDYKEESVAS